MTAIGTARTTRAELRQRGRELRVRVPRRSHAAWAPAPERDALAILRAQEDVRVEELVPVRYGRMLASPFAFYRGAAAVMAADLAGTPVTGVEVQACGDAHLLNFGTFASPERRLVFDINDFDETHTGAWEWDLKRLAASFVVAARDAGLRDDQARDAAAGVVRAYQQMLAEAACLTPLEIFHGAISIDELHAEAAREGIAAQQRIDRLQRRSLRHTSLQAARKLTEPDGAGGMRICEQPPLIVRVDDETRSVLDDFLTRYAASLPAYRAHVLSRYRIADAARKVVGVGSVGLRAFIILLVAEADGDPLFLQVKEAVGSVIGTGRFRGEEGRRVVEGQQLMQAFGDPFLGWVTYPGADFYVRQFHDMKGSAQPEGDSAWFDGYGRLCGATLARAHARSAYPALLAGYAGTSERLQDAIADFSVRYADRSEADWEELKRAVRDGRVAAVLE
ncbi:MAG TPA: DUF2252 domain-containing protein [Conexibacter sp.]|jgi:uncharacterized protein (DUF2252 family)